MSEALSSSEIEDVLSSIRRLVSDDMRPASRGPAPAAPEGDKLLLTPALRVVQPSSPAAAAPAIEEVLASVSAKVDAQGEDWESETGDLSLSPAEPMAAEDWSLPEIFEQEVAEAPFAEAEVEEDEPVLTFVSHRTEAEPRFEDAPQAEAEPWAEASAAEPEILIPPEVLSAPAESASLDAPLPGWAQPSDPDEDEASAPEAWSAATIEPDRAWADEAEAEVLQELAAGNAAPSPHGPDSFEMETDAAPVAELPVSEEVLREIVRDVLREELQGRLGERITRNIRKLVRAEIARAMATDEFL